MQLADTPVATRFRQRTAKSRELAERARQTFPSGVTHDGRYLLPYPIYVEHAEGSRKWDVDGNEYVDYVGGHGALLLGHNHPEVMQAVGEQLRRGTHYGSGHELEIRWGELVQRLIPSAERVRFTSSGTEATLLALRLARAVTGQPKILRFATNFHGWHDHVAFGVGSNFDGQPTPGVLEQVASQTVLCPPGDIAAVRQVLQERGDIAAVILEPTGATWGQVPIQSDFLHELRELTLDRHVLLIFDEVITGFRCSPGGAQRFYGVTPDITTLAKILAGGFPGGAVVGRREVMEWLDFEASAESARQKIPHQGTFNANPVSAAAGVAALTLVAETDACQRANDYGAKLRTALREVLQSARSHWRVYGSFSGFHLYTNPDHDDVSEADLDAGRVDYRKIKAAAASPEAKLLRLACLTEGVDIFGWPGGPTSSAHTTDDLERTVEAMRVAVESVK